MAADPFTLKVWTLHPNACVIRQAEKTLGGTANEQGVKWCGPFSYANRTGWWVYSPVDIDILWKGGREFEHKLHTPYSDYDYHLIRRLLTRGDGVDPDKWCLHGGRTKFSWGAVEDAVVQMWTGCIFETPPGWALQIRSPVNWPARSCHVMEGVLETDWLQYDIWINLVFDRAGEWVELRRDGPPVAHLLPVRREAYEQDWSLRREEVNRDTGEANRVFEYYVQYNHQKFGLGGKQPLAPNTTKDSTTYFRERKRLLGPDGLPAQEPVRPKEPKARSPRLYPRYKRPERARLQTGTSPPAIAATPAVAPECPYHALAIARRQLEVAAGGDTSRPGGDTTGSDPALPPGPPPSE